MVGSKQPTICWYVDNPKISYADGNEVSKMIRWLESEWGEMHKLRGDRHNYLVMWMDYYVPGEVQISMEDSLRGVLDYFLEYIM